ncbi:hypothetical protein [Ohtaekwangia koreensis]|jgi:hypothetical protein|uniref:Uncharacterized protein n=1 Tax=Ohtaekwangia koreensis TaxID=688867 RepID=A0A1T5LEA1_9BACT|nr:hypothetical protein [Ohtaekwangia koreensis]SKC74387.1 hypothetical protein SAMN05660236_3065 [Ohtaekwangia koreensis]
MKAPISKRTRKILDNPQLAKQLMLAIIADRLVERSMISEDERPTIKVDGEELKLVRLKAFDKK